jgi:malonyl-CoA O-methyltransferase
MTESAIVRRFGAAAATYDTGADVQRAVARDLLALCPQDTFSILEIGCGTGNYTALLHEAFPNGRITATDVSPEMVQTASKKISSDRVRFLAAGAHAYPGGPYDLITANAALHWLPDLNGSLARFSESLHPGGCLVFSYFGRETYRELRSALTKTLATEVTLPSDSFSTPNGLAATLQRHFGDCEIQTIEYKEDFASVRELLANIRATGTQGAGASPKIAWTPGLLKRVERQYLEQFGTITATYQVTLCRARP